MNHRPNLLIVDDSEENLVFLDKVIQKVNINMIKALSGPEALEKIRGIELALAIIDVRMPGMNGYELALKMNEERPEVKVPIIFITASHVNETQVFEGYGSGAVDYIFKPVNNQILLSKINVFLDLFNQKHTIIRDRELLERSADELTRVNNALKKSEEKYRSYIDNAPSGVFVADQTGRFIEVNEEACRETGYSKEELLEMSISDILPKESIKHGLAHFRKALNNGSSKADLQFSHKNGTTRWWTVGVVKFDDTRFLGFTEEITHRKEMEEALRKQKVELEMQNDELNRATIKAEVASRKYSELYDFAPSGYFTLSSENTIQELNHSGAHILGKERSDLLGSHFGFFVSKDTLPAYNTFFLNIFNSRAKEICELMLENNDGRAKYVHVEGMVVGNGSQCFLNVIDITDRKMAEQAVKISEEKYKTMLNASPDGILLIDMHGIITEVSEIGLELFGTDTRADLIGKDFHLFILPDDINIIKEITERTLSEGLAQNIEIKIRKKNQSLFAGEISTTLIQDPDGAPISFMIIIRDISFRKKMEAKQIHADRMANLGEMASGIAHEINQPLNTISLVMDNILYEAVKDENIPKEYLKKKLDRIFENIARIRNIIDHVRAFSRSQDSDILTGFDINSSIKNAVAMVQEQFKHLAISMNLNLEEDLPFIKGNTFKFEQVVLNLLSNAKDALVEKKSKQSESFDMFVGIRSFQENQRVIIEIIDNGSGISDEDIEHIMLPFYTTKDSGKGTGLGLSISYQIIREMNGTIEITSNILYGTIFKIILKVQNKE